MTTQLLIVQIHSALLIVLHFALYIKPQRIIKKKRKDIESCEMFLNLFFPAAFNLTFCPFTYTKLQSEKVEGKIDIKKLHALNSLWIKLCEIV